MLRSGLFRESGPDRIKRLTANGKARMASLTKAQRTELSQKAVRAREARRTIKSPHPPTSSSERGLPLNELEKPEKGYP